MECAKAAVDRGTMLVMECVVVAKAAVDRGTMFIIECAMAAVGRGTMFIIECAKAAVGKGTMLGIEFVMAAVDRGTMLVMECAKAAVGRGTMFVTKCVVVAKAAVGRDTMFVMECGMAAVGRGTMFVMECGMAAVDRGTMFVIECAKAAVGRGTMFVTKCVVVAKAAVGRGTMLGMECVVVAKAAVDRGTMFVVECVLVAKAAVDRGTMFVIEFVMAASCVEMGEEVTADLHNQRISVLLVSLASVVVWCEALRPHALYALLHACHQHHVSALLVAAVLDRVAVALDTTRRELLFQHLQELLDCWFGDRLPLSDFPLTVLDETDVSILLTKCPDHLLYYSLTRHPPTLDWLADVSGYSKKDILTENLPELLAMFAPCLVQHVTGHDATSHVPGHDATSHVTGHDATSHVTAHDATSHVTGHDVPAADEAQLRRDLAAFKRLQVAVGDDAVANVVRGRLARLIIRLLSLSHWAAPLGAGQVTPFVASAAAHRHPPPQGAGEVVPTIAAPHQPPAVVAHSLTHLSSTLQLHHNLLEMSAKDGGALHEVLLTLHCQLMAADAARTMRRALAALAALCPALVQALQTRPAAFAKVARTMRRALAALAALCPALVQALQTRPAAFAKVEFVVIPMVVRMLSSCLERAASLRLEFVEQIVKILKETLSGVLNYEHLHATARVAVTDLVPKLRAFCHDLRPGWRCCCELLTFILTDHEMIVETTSQFPPLFPNLETSQLTAPLKVLHDQHYSLVRSRGRHPENLCSEVAFFRALPLDEWALEHLLRLLQASSEQQISELSPDLVSTLTLRLFNVCSSQDDTLVTPQAQQTAGSCLGLIRPQATRTSLESPCPQVPPPNSAEASTLEDLGLPWVRWQEAGSKPLLGVKEGRVVLVLGCLVERLDTVDPAVCRASSEALCRIVQSQQVQEVLPLLHRQLKSRLCLLQTSQRPDPETPPSAVSTDIRHDGKWRTGESADTWLRRLLVLLLSSDCGCPVLASTKSVCGLDAALCKRLLPFVVHAKLTHDPHDARVHLSSLMDTTLSLWNHHDLVHRPLVVKVVNCALDCVEMLWGQRPPVSYCRASAPTALDGALWLQVAPTLVASAAHWVGRQALALVFLEEHRPL
ncbi:uncharacterized protein LOC125178167, partial [Hyalella azteca]|uniref:Uncharacterized protein LOC125178167 n=1 Tax=Hyalella azteca TaxID=294128 RepID=A0A979FKP2_HYAAZ